ncbi:prolipoprotein diacylglyceryl transferase [Candidatus Woesearchaeota archaeon]|nr:prolipoprotein diacylglyceryl transferase [Candidatus Woesearchaeota archaeon]
MINIPYIPEINIFSIKIHTWGLFAALAFLAAYLLSIKRTKYKDYISNQIILTLIASFIGARILFIIENFQLFSNNLLNIFYIWDGGLSSSGGIIFALIVSYIYSKKKNISFLETGNILAPGIALAFLLGRIGCLFGDIHLGMQTTQYLPWAIMQNSIPSHPIKLYYILALSLVLITIYLVNKFKKHVEFYILTITYSITRFISEFFVLEPRYLNLTIAQSVSIGLLILTLTLLIIKTKHKA